MAHIPTIVEGPKIWYDLFLSDMEKLQYTYKANYNQTGIIGPMVREIHFLDITVPEQNLDEFLSDIAPFMWESSKQKKTVMLAKFGMNSVFRLSSLFKGVKLHKIPEGIKTTENVRTRGMNVLPLCWFEDPTVESAELIFPLKKGGVELL